jgi:hypothetical protein
MNGLNFRQAIVAGNLPASMLQSDLADWHRARKKALKLLVRCARHKKDMPILNVQEEKNVGKRFPLLKFRNNPARNY